ncbi:MAG: Wzz/FepE/Etk N-terminal domain-containing protein [Deinococcales bacterium]
MSEPHQPEQEISLRDIYLILRRNIAVVLVFPVCFAILAALYAYLIADPVYKSEASLTIQTTPVQSKLENKIETNTTSAFTSDQIETVAYSRPILDKLIKFIRSSNTAPTSWRVERFDVSQLEKKLKLKFPKANRLGSIDASLVTLEVSAPDPRLAAELTNAWASETSNALNLLPQARVSDSIKALEGEIRRAGENLAVVEKKYQGFTDTSNLALEQAELASATSERAGLEPLIAQTKQGILQTQGELSRRSSDLARAAQTLNITADNTAVLGVATNGQTLAQVRRTLTQQVAQAKQKMLDANEALRLFNSSNDAPLLRGRIAQNESRLIEINAKLQSFTSSLKTLTAQLNEARAQLKNQPRITTLERELLGDPVISAAIQTKDPKLNDLVGLKLQNQEINPIYQQLLQSIIGLQANIESLTAERDAIMPEATKRQAQLENDRRRLAALNKNAEPLALEVRNAQTNYENINAQLNRLSGVDEAVLTRTLVENTNPEYQRLRTLVNDLSSNLERLKVTLTGYESRAKELDGRIEKLKTSVAKNGLESTRISQALELAREQYKVLSQKLTDLTIEQASSKTLAQVLVPAFAPTRPEGSRATIVLLAVVAGLLVGLIAPFILEALRDPHPVAAKLGNRPLLAGDD